MNKQKGFIGIGAIIAIIAVLVIAGGTTYAVKHKAQVKSQTQIAADVSGDGVAEINTGTRGNASSKPAGIAIDEPGVQVTSTTTVPGVSVSIGGQVSSSSQSDGWFYVPELHAKFKNVAGFTAQYKQFRIESAPWPAVEGIEFTSKEINARAQIDPKIASCTSVGRVTLSTTTKAEIPAGDYKAFHEVSLGNGHYLRTDSPQAPCYENGTSKESLDVLSMQAKLFAQFLDSGVGY